MGDRDIANGCPRYRVTRMKVASSKDAPTALSNLKPREYKFTLRHEGPWGTGIAEIRALKVRDYFRLR